MFCDQSYNQCQTAVADITTCFSLIHIFIFPQLSKLSSQERLESPHTFLSCSSKITRFFCAPLSASNTTFAVAPFLHLLIFTFILHLLHSPITSVALTTFPYSLHSTYIPQRTLPLQPLLLGLNFSLETVVHL